MHFSILLCSTHDIFFACAWPNAWSSRRLVSHQIGRDRSGRGRGLEELHEGSRLVGSRRWMTHGDPGVIARSAGRTWEGRVVSFAGPDIGSDDSTTSTTGSMMVGRCVSFPSPVPWMVCGFLCLYIYMYRIYVYYNIYYIYILYIYTIYCIYYTYI